MTDDSEWPRISVVTPSYNQAQFIEATLRSVLLQGYPNLEYIVIDGHSIDNSVEIIQKYDNQLAYWVSEPDRGQPHALNKGIDKATGEIFTFINSDDLLAPNSLAQIANHFHSQRQSAVLQGGHAEIDESGTVTHTFPEMPFVSHEDLILAKTYVHQTGMFWKTEAFERIGNFREDLQYTFDLDFFIRLLMHYELDLISGIFSYTRIHDQAKTQRLSSILKFSQEKRTVLLEFLPKVQGRWLSKFLAYRSITLNHLDTVMRHANTSLHQDFLLLLANPILFTSPSALSRAFSRK